MIAKGLRGLKSPLGLRPIYFGLNWVPKVNLIVPEIKINQLRFNLTSKLKGWIFQVVMNGEFMSKGYKIEYIILALQSPKNEKTSNKSQPKRVFFLIWYKFTDASLIFNTLKCILVSRMLLMQNVKLLILLEASATSAIQCKFIACIKT